MMRGEYRSVTNCGLRKMQFVWQASLFYSWIPWCGNRWVLSYLGRYCRNLSCSYSRHGGILTRGVSDINTICNSKSRTYVSCQWMFISDEHKLPVFIGDCIACKHNFMFNFIFLYFCFYYMSLLLVRYVHCFIFCFIL